MFFSDFGLTSCTRRVSHLFAYYVVAKKQWKTKVIVDGRRVRSIVGITTNRSNAPAEQLRWRVIDRVFVFRFSPGQRNM